MLTTACVTVVNKERIQTSLNLFYMLSEPTRSLRYNAVYHSESQHTTVNRFNLAPYRTKAVCRKRSGKQR